MNFCEKIKELRRKRLCKQKEVVYHFQVAEQIQDLPFNQWNQLVKPEDLFMQPSYFACLEELSDKKIPSRYVLVYKENALVLCAYFQVIDIPANVFGDLINDHTREIVSHRKNLFSKYLDHKKEEVVVRILTCGNNFLSSQQAMRYRNISEKEAFFVLDKILEKLTKEEKLRGKVSVTLVKDFDEEKTFPAERLNEDEYFRFNAEPNMLLELSPGIQSLEEYIQLFSKKYRNRAKTILKKGATLIRKEFSLNEVKLHENSIFDLYEQIYGKAKFKLIKLPQCYFSALKQVFPNNFFIHGYFLEDRLIAFDSCFHFADCIEAHYIGLDYPLNKEYEVYQNILYAFIQDGINLKKPLVNLGRTASEIKSTTGAKARNLVCYLKPHNTVSKLVLKPFVSFLQPSDWIPRNPFKEEQDEQPAS